MLIWVQSISANGIQVNALEIGFMLLFHTLCYLSFCNFSYRKIPKFSDSKIFSVIYLKIQIKRPNIGSVVKRCKWNSKQ